VVVSSFGDIRKLSSESFRQGKFWLLRVACCVDVVADVEVRGLGMRQDEERRVWALVGEARAPLTPTLSPGEARGEGADWSEPQCFALAKTAPSPPASPGERVGVRGALASPCPYLQPIAYCRVERSLSKLGTLRLIRCIYGRIQGGRHAVA